MRPHTPAGMTLTTGAPADAAAERQRPQQTRRSGLIQPYRILAIRPGWDGHTCRYGAEWRSRRPSTAIQHDGERVTGLISGLPDLRAGIIWIHLFRAGSEHGHCVPG